MSGGTVVEFKLLAEEFAMGAHADQLENMGVWLAVDQEQVRSEVAFAMVIPFAGELMVAVFLRKSFIC